MSTYTEFFLKTSSNVVQLELVEIVLATSPVTRFRLVRNSLADVTVTLETGSQATFTYYPLKITPVGIRDNLDFALRVDFGDLGEALPPVLDTLRTQGLMLNKPQFIYRTYRNDLLLDSSSSYGRIVGPIQLEIGEIAFTSTGASFEAKAPSLNTARTGRSYNFVDFPMLRGFV